METIDETAIINQAPLPNQGIPEHESFTPSTDDCRRDTVVITFVVVGSSPIIVGRSKFRFEPDGLVVVGYRPVVLPFVVIGIPAVEVGESIRLELDGLIEVGYRRIEIFP